MCFGHTIESWADCGCGGVNEIEQRIVGVLEALDEAGNAALGRESNIPEAGNPHYTCSQRWGQYLISGTPSQKFRARIYDFVLTWVENRVFGGNVESHCIAALTGMPTNLPWTG